MTHTPDDYHSTAPIYDLILSLPLRPIRKAIHTFVRRQGHQHILDICCGTGEQLRRLHGPEMELTGIDLSPAMLAQARKKSPAPIAYLEMDGTRMDFGAKRFDCAIISFALHEKSRQIHDQIFTKAMEVIRPDGHLLLCDFCRVGTGPLARFFGHSLIPMVEKHAGEEHFSNYQQWMRSGALEGFCGRHGLPVKRLGSHFGGCVQLISIIKK